MIIAKCITNKMKIILLRIIFNSESQSAFIPGRLIYDISMVMFETSNFQESFKRKKRNNYYKVRYDEDL